jgi:hypothetical protein
VSFDVEERSSRQLFNVPMTCTDSEARWIYLQLADRQEWIEWFTVDGLVKCGTFNAASSEGEQLVAREARAFRTMSKLTAELVERMEARR